MSLNRDLEVEERDSQTSDSDEDDEDPEKAAPKYTPDAIELAQEALRAGLNNKPKRRYEAKKTLQEAYPDASELAQEAFRSGLITKDVLKHLTSLHSQVPNVMKYRYLLMHMYSTLNSDDRLLVKMVEVFAKYQSHPLGKPASDTTKPDYRLGEGCIADLIEFLVPYASHWRNIGTALRFKPQELNNILASQSYASDMPKSCLIRLLEDWVQKKCWHTLDPTVSSLEKALKSHTVGLGALASEVRTRIVPKEILKSEETQYYTVNIELEGTSKELQVTTNFMGKIEVKENASILLETKVISVEDMALQYQWLADGKPISDDLVHRDTKMPILCISNADIDMDGCMYSCKVTIDGHHEIETEGATLRVSCPLDQHRSSLVALYTAQPEVPKDTWPPVSGAKHINLALITQEQVDRNSEYARLTIRGDMDDILPHKQVIKYNDFVKNLKSKHVVLIKGWPGCGKTTFVHKITHDWAVTTHGAMRLVLLVSLRVLNDLNKPNLDLSDILSLFKDLKVDARDLEERKGKGICFILDGLDEFSPSNGKGSVVYKIINKEYLTQATVIVASCPGAIAHLRSRADKVVEVLGFRNEQIFEYFDCYPFSAKSKARDLRVYLPYHPNILHMCYLPIHAAMVGFLFEVTGRVPTTESEIYKHFTHCTIMRSLSKNRNIEDIDTQNLNRDEKEQFTQICELALEKTVLNKQVLSQREVTLSKKDTLGLITVDRTADLYGFKDIYTFLHLTFQEYLAALHISTLNEKEQLYLLEKYGGATHMMVVWKFFCSLVEFNAKNEHRFRLLCDKTPGQTLYHVQCAYESQQSLPCTLLPSSFEFSNKCLTTSDCTAIGYALNQSKSIEMLAITTCYFDVEAIKALLLPMKDNTNLQSLHFHFLHMDNIEVECLFLITKQVQSLTKLSLKSKPLKIKAFPTALADSLHYCTNIEELDLSNNDFGDAGAHLLASGLTTCKKLTRINISGNAISADGALTIFRSLSQCQLQVTSEDVLVGNKMNSTELAYILRHCVNIQSLAVVFDTSELPSLSEKWKTLKELKLHVLVQHAQRIGIVTTAIAQNIRDHFHGLHTLLLDNFYMRGNSEGVKSLAEGLARCPNLQVLDLSNSIHFDVAGIKLIITSLIECRELYLNNCGINLEGVIALGLSLSLQHCQKLIILGLNTNEIDFIGARSLLYYLRDCTHLKKLDLRNNLITPETPLLASTQLTILRI